MRKAWGLAATAAAVALLVPGVGLAEYERDPAVTDASAVGRITPGERSLLVTFRDRPDAAQVAERLAGLGQPVPLVPDIGVWQLRVVDPATARAAVEARPGVARAEWPLARTTDALTDPRPVPGPALPLIALPDPTDPLYAQPSPAQQWSLRQGNWTAGLSGYDRPIIAILDSGLDSTHEEWATPGLVVSPRSTVRDVNTADDVELRGHGTHVAGIAAAPANGVGVVGVAPAAVSPSGPGVSTVMPVQIADALGRSSDLTMIKGIVWAVDHGAKVINISSGGPGYEQVFQDVVNWAFKRGVIITASVGNEGLDDNTLNYPAAYDHVIGVGAQCDAVIIPGECPVAFQRARFSNFNRSVDVLAPGVNVASTVPLAVVARPISPGYAFKDGTSMASPFVAGVAALIYASHPGITPYQVTRILQRTSSRAAVGRSSSDGWGIVNPLAAAQAQAPVDDLSEINDDVKWLAQRDNLRVTVAPKRLRARADVNDDPFDLYPVILRRGERMRVTIVASSARLELRVFKPGATTLSPRTVAGRNQRSTKQLGAARFTTPGTRAVVVRATATGRHYIAVQALAGGGDYTVKIQRL